MNKELYKVLYENEDNHWWFLAMREIKRDQLNKYVTISKKTKLLDAGCGTGGFIKYMNKYATCYGIDSSDEAINYCKKRGLKKIYKSKIQTLPFSDSFFDVVVCNDVLYHKSIKNKEVPLKEFHRVLKKGGVLLVFDISSSVIKSKHDESFDVDKRFSRKELNQHILNAHFKILKSSYCNFVLFPGVYVLRVLKKLFQREKKSDIHKTNKLLNKTLYRLLLSEKWILRKANQPFGSSIMVIAKK
jgi:ubiquinone/menaquinone biosynthesis C-methylase UbiE